jgi:acyl-CoA synthetase (NDP forming)
MSGTSFERLFSPRGVAVFGSVKENRIAHQICVQMTRGGYPGVLVSVNPGAERPEGIKDIPAYADVTEAPGDIDLAVLAVPARYAAESLASCGKKGIPFAVVLTSGFSETGDRAAEENLRRTAVENHIRIIGPNCAGIMSTPAKLFASIEERALPGCAALVSQSGAVGAAALAMAGERGIGFSRFVSIGNRADIDESDMLDYLALDEGTAMAALYLESVADGRKFLSAASRFSERKPLVLIKAGRSRAGTRAACSHTGSIAGSDEVFTAACAQTGAIRVDGIEELLDLCCGFEHYPTPRGERLLIVTNSGGPGILTSDRAENLGLRVEPPSVDLHKRLKEKLLPNASAQNPVDLTVEGGPQDFAFALSSCLSRERIYVEAIATFNVGTPFLVPRGSRMVSWTAPDKPPENRSSPCSWRGASCATAPSASDLLACPPCPRGNAPPP